MPFDIPSEPVPIPARLVERALDLARAEVGLALVHTRRIAVRAVSALLATIVACAFAQLTIVLLVAWPVLAERVPLPNLLAGVGFSVLFAAGGGLSAFWIWSGAQERKPSHSMVPAASTSSQALSPSVPPVAAMTSTEAATSPAAAVGTLGKGPATASVPPGPSSGTDPARNVVVSRQRRFDTREEPAGATLAERVGS